MRQLLQNVTFITKCVGTMADGKRNSKLGPLNQNKRKLFDFTKQYVKSSSKSHCIAADPFHIFKMVNHDPKNLFIYVS